MIHIKKYGGRLGNHLFHYAYARCLAEHMGYALRVPMVNGFDNAININGKIVKEPRVLIKYGSQKNGKVETIEHLAERCQGKLIEISCGEINVDLYEGKWGKIKGWFRKKTKTKLTKDDLVVHVRLGDFLQYKNRVLPIEYYKAAIEEIEYNKLYVCSDSPYHKRLKWFRGIGATIVKKNAIDTFRFIESANKIIISNSSFSWWAAVLSDAEEIIVPHGRVIEKKDLWTDCKFMPFPRNARYALVLGKSVKISG